MYSKVQGFGISIETHWLIVVESTVLYPRLFVLVYLTVLYIIYVTFKILSYNLL